jgi:prolyl 4-hydroxylase
MSVVDQAYALADAGRSGAAAELLERAGEAGDSAAWVELAVWFLSGQVVDRNLARSRDCFRRAGECGHDQAAMIYLSFLAIGVGGDRDWPGAVGLLRKRAEADAEAARQVTLLELMSLDEDGNPLSIPQPAELSRSPYVATFERLFTREECDYLVALASPVMQASVIVDPRTGQMRPDPIRSSDAAMLAWVDENPVVHALNRRIAAASASLVEAGEPLQVLRYQPGQEYRPHHDALPGASNQRVSTLLVYLNEDFTGGETSFPAAGLTYKGGAGDALLFRNAHPDGRIDQAALHAGLPVTRGCKFIASRWVHERQFAALR